METTKPNRLTQTQFFKAAEALKQNAEEFKGLKLTRHETAQRISKLVGFTVTPSSIGTLMEATGITWVSRNSHPKNGKGTTSHAIAILTRALVHIYKKLGEPPTVGLERLFQIVNSKEVSRSLTQLSDDDK